MTDLPSHNRALIMSEGKGKLGGEVWHPISVSNIPLPTPNKDQVLIKISATALNHRDIWIRKGMYFGITFPSILGSDCVGTVVGPPSSPMMGKRVLPYPGVGWMKDPHGPDVPGKPFGLLGGTKETGGVGTFAEYMCVDSSYCVEAPAHLSDEAAAALPLGAVTAWRALVVKAGIKSGDNVLITGIGGGVALQALQFAVALGARIWVTSGSEQKLKKAKEFGAEGGVCYTEEGWPRKLKTMLPDSKPFFDFVLDSGGGDIMTKSGMLLKEGGMVVGYGSTTGSPINITMSEILKNFEYKGTTLGSFTEYKSAIEFVGKHHLEPIVHTVIQGLDRTEEGFEMMKKGKQFGKIVMKISGNEAEAGRRGKY